MLPLATSTWDENEYEALQKVIDSGMFSMGPKVKEFEEAFAAYIGSKYAVMVNSGSSANLAGVAALRYHSKYKLLPGDEVIVPAVSWSTTYYPLYQYGLKLKFVDIDAKTLNLDLKQLRSSIGPNTKAIFAVNLLGNPLNYEEIKQIIDDKSILLFEDNCESLGASLGDKKAGNFGVFGTHSTYFSHHISTMEGGVVTTNDEELYHILLSLRSHGWTRHLPVENKLCKKSDNPFEESFRFILPGYNLRPLEMSGALGIEQLKKLPEIIDGRRKNAEKFVSMFSSIPGISIQAEVGKSSWFGFAIVVEGGKSQRDKIVAKLTDLGIECRPIVAGNFAKNPVVEHFDFTTHGSLKNADHVDECGFFIGNHHYDISEQLEKISSALNSLVSTQTD